MHGHKGAPNGEINIGIGKRLRAMRNASGLSQSHLADALGVSFQQVQKYERGLNRLPSTQLYVAAAALGCSVTDILGGDAQNGANGEASEIMKMLATRGGMEMSRAFMALSPPRRRAIVDLMREFQE
jgi:transcriptional regulator with XRE-family HTH domain